jgi:hypothetical protein
MTIMVNSSCDLDRNRNRNQWHPRHSHQNQTRVQTERNKSPFRNGLSGKSQAAWQQDPLDVLDAITEAN